MLVMLSGGRDSVCLLHLLASRGPVRAMHMNYGLRAESGEDEALCRDLCAGMGVPLRVVRPCSPASGNVQAWARDERYAAALTLTDGDVAVAHTASDQAETVLYRLLASPGRRALLGMREREGRLVRPLLSWTREQTTAYCAEHGLAWRDDASNEDERFARNRIRALLATFPAGEASLLRTLELLRDEAEVLDSLVRPEPSVERLRELPPALLRLTLQRMADDAGGAVAVGDPERALRGADLGGGLRSVVEHGRLRFTTEGRQVGPPPVALTVPSQVGFGDGIVEAEWAELTTGDGVLDAAAAVDGLVVRAWRAGDRMRPLGMGGRSKSLQDLFTDRKVPRERRHRLPVVEARGEIAWIPGVVSESFRARGGPSLRLTWREN